MSRTMKRYNPEQLHTPQGFSHVTVAPATEKIAFISGQVSYNEQGEVIGAGDIGAQTAQIFQNLQHALSAIGASFQDILKFTFFVKNLDHNAMAEIRRVRAEYLDGDALPASTMVGVGALAKPDLLLEVEAYVLTGRVE